MLVGSADGLTFKIPVDPSPVDKTLAITALLDAAAVGKKRQIHTTNLMMKVASAPEAAAPEAAAPEAAPEAAAEAAPGDDEAPEAAQAAPEAAPDAVAAVAPVAPVGQLLHLGEGSAASQTSGSRRAPICGWRTLALATLCGRASCGSKCRQRNGTAKSWSGS